MSARGKVWLIGLALTAFLAGSLAWNESARELTIPTILLALGVNALLAEAATLRSLGGQPGRPRPPEGARPADGVVDRIVTSAVEAFTYWPPIPDGGDSPGWRTIPRHRPGSPDWTGRTLPSWVGWR